MPRIFLACFLVPSLSLTSFADGEAPPFVHVHTDRNSYRLGETLWYRVHTRGREPVLLSFIGPDGQEALKVPAPAADAAGDCGRFLIPAQLSGGAYRLAARAGDAVVQELPIEIWDLEAPKLDLELTVAGTLHFPAGTVVAAFRARDLRGQPVRGARVEYRAVFGPLAIRSAAGLTDEEGRAVIRFQLPAEVRGSGRLSAGVSCAGREAAISRPVPVSASVARVDAFPEGGGILEGAPQRLGLLVRDLNGDPTASEGRVVDDQGNTVCGFATDHFGLAVATVPYEKGRRYRAVIDLPAGVNGEFSLPGPTGHAYALAVREEKEAFAIEVRGKRPKGERLRILLAAGDRVLSRTPLSLRSEGKGQLPAARLQVPRPRERGLGRILLLAEGRAILERTVFLGASSPVEVTAKALGGPLLPGRTIELELSTTRGGHPVPADISLSIFQGDSAGIPDLAARAALFSPSAPLSGPAGEIPPELLADEARREPFLIVREAFSLPAEGLPLAGDDPPPLERARTAPPPVPPRPPLDPVASARSVVTAARPTAFERRLERAHFTRSARPEADGESDRFGPRVEPEALLAQPGLGSRSAAPPQDLRWPPGILDARRTLFWNGRVTTDASGKATVRFRLNHFVSALSWVAQGSATQGSATQGSATQGSATQGSPAAGGKTTGKSPAHSPRVNGEFPVSGRGVISPIPSFRTRLEFPERLRTGDVVDLLVEIHDERDDNGGPIALQFKVPPCLRPLLRTAWDWDPRTDARLQRFQFEATGPAESAELVLIARRGFFEEARRRSFRVSRNEVELSLEREGRDRGRQLLATRVPENALPGSVRLYGSVAPGVAGQAMESVVDLLQEPHGCFEQFTSINYLTLTALDALLRQGEDPAALERGFLGARHGYQRLLTHLDPVSGAFSLFPGGQAAPLPTLVAVRQLALHAAIFGGEGRRALEGALRWLEKRPLAPMELLHLTLSLHDLGRPWKRSLEAARLVSRTPCEEALQANCLAEWPGPAPSPKALGGRALESRLEPLLDRIEGVVTSASRGIPARGKEGEVSVSLDGALDEALEGSTGLMGSAGATLGVEFLALAAVALDAGGRRESAQECLAALAGRERQYGGTLGRALAVRAWSRLGDPVPARSFEVEFSSEGGGTERAFARPGQARPVRFERAVPLGPGSVATLSLDIRSEKPEAYRLGMSYLVSAPRSSPTAPFSIDCGLDARADQGGKVTLRVSIEPRRATSSSQVVARIGLPAGIEILPPSGDPSGEGYREVKDGFLVLYWARPIQQPVHLTIPARARFAGEFTAPPSVVYPYYEAGREAFASAGLRIRVNANFGSENPATPWKGKPLPLSIPPVHGR